MKKKIITLILLGILGGCFDGNQKEESIFTRKKNETHKEERNKLVMEIYKDGFGRVRDERVVDVKNGVNTITFENVSPSIIDGSSYISGDEIVYLGESYSYEPITMKNILKKYEGKKLTFYNRKKERERITGRLVASTPEVIVKVKNSYMVINMDEYSVVIDEIPKDLSNTPSINFDFKGSRGEKNITLSYFTRNINWKTKYIGVYDQSTNTFKVRPMAQITNGNESKFEDVTLTLAAGDIPFNQGYINRSYDEMVEVSSEIQTTSPSSNSKMYTLPAKVTLNGNESKTLPLFEEKETKALEYSESNYFYSLFGPSNSVDSVGQVKLDFENPYKESIPSGSIKIYGKDSRLGDVFVGEAYLGDTSKGEKVSLDLGEDFDLGITRIVKERKKSNLSKNPALTNVKKEEEGKKEAVIVEVEVKIDNKGDKKKVVALNEIIPEEGYPLEDSIKNGGKVDGKIIKYMVEVEGESTKKITFKYRVWVDQYSPLVEEYKI